MIVNDIAVTLLDSCGSDLNVVNAARVSFNKEVSGELTDKDAKLINYLAKHKHFSPFNHAFLSFRVKAPIFVARQLVKHKFLPWNEVSRRYVKDEPEFYFSEVWRKAADNVKQGSSDEEVILSDNHAFIAVYTALNAYETLLREGVCPEQARMVLPQNTMTEWIWSGTLGAWADMCRLRLDPHTQYETRQVALKIAEQVKYKFPISFKALLEN